MATEPLESKIYELLATKFAAISDLLTDEEIRQRRKAFVARAMQESANQRQGASSSLQAPGAELGLDSDEDEASGQLSDGSGASQGSGRSGQPGEEAPTQIT